ncbi:AIM24 family protein [Sphaerisporangium sp. TRM90804]|uniref:AIM24 family protein n=1 Tax=Sphaerisporangium sp. TRM90804 TaxID=3031113 RepID=UPI002447F6B8|nr:AIM24 family protein [Sphaerisporangium sp. TRM90804]MDH2425301.1 AIM24 family protein [Sphaerisporangium sp. TRM90804]
MRSSFFANLDSGQLPGHFVMQNSKMLRVHLRGEVLARQGSMVAFQGKMEFDYEGSGGVGRLLKKMVTGEGAPLMRVRGEGALFLAHEADDVHLFYLENEALTVNGANLLAFDPQLTWDIQRVQGAGMATGGLFNTTIRGTGWVAITAHGTPVVLDTASAPTFADAQAAVCWDAALQVGVNRTAKLGALIGRGSGEAVQLAFSGRGFVLVQASEGPTVPPHSHGN